MEKITRAMIRSAEKVLADNGVDPLEVETVLQSLGYILFDKELYSAQTELTDLHANMRQVSDPEHIT